MDLEAYVDIVPWLLFVVVDRRAGLGLSWAAASAMGCGLAIAGWSHWRGRRTPIGWVAVGVFGCLVMVALAVNRQQQWFEPALRASSVTALGVTAFLSLRRRPLSEVYTAERVPAQRRDEAAFYQVNRRITAAWGTGALLIAGSFAGAAAMPSAIALTLFDWVLPIAILGVVLRWVAVQWAAYQVPLEVAGAPSLVEAPVGRPVSDTLRVVRDEPPSPSPEPRVTYQPGS